MEYCSLACPRMLQLAVTVREWTNCWSVMTGSILHYIGVDNTMCSISRLLQLSLRGVVITVMYLQIMPGFE